MTIAIEYVWAVEAARVFLRKLLDPKQTPRIPLKMRREALFLLKHYPHPKLDFERIWRGWDWKKDPEVRDVIEKMKLCSDRSQYE